MIDKRRTRREALHRALGASNSLKAGIAELVTALEGAVQADRENGIEGALKGATTIAPHRRDHRPGRRAKLAADPGLRAFALARLGAMTFEQIANTVAVALPPERRVRRSAIHQWWKRHHQRTIQAGRG